MGPWRFDPGIVHPAVNYHQFVLVYFAITNDNCITRF